MTNPKMIPDHLDRRFDKDRTDLAYKMFVGEVVHVDFERKVLYIKRADDGFIFTDVTRFPANASSKETTNVDMPEEGTSCLCVPLYENSGFVDIAVACYLVSATESGQLGIAHRPIDGLDGYTDRKRGLYRKAYPGESTKWTPLGYTDRTDQGWDRQAMDLSRDKLDPFRGTWYRSSSNSSSRTSFQFHREGLVSRPGADSVFPVALPDGSKESVLYLKQTQSPASDPRGRYLNGDPDFAPITESTRKVMEFGLDFPVPLEAWDSEDLLDGLLGLTLGQDKWWSRTSVVTSGNVQTDDQTPVAQQSWDHPDGSSAGKGLGPTTHEGPTPRRKGWILEQSEGTLVGSNQFDPATYGKVLKPTLFPNKFSQDTTSTHLPVKGTSDQAEVKLAASMWSWRAPYEYNTTRFDVTKEGLLQFELGSTLPKENVQWDGGTYEHPNGAGRSIEGATTGSVKLVLGKNRDDEESLDLATTGAVVMRLGADDTSVPDARRTLLTQMRGKKDTLGPRSLQMWTQSGVKLTPGDGGDLNNKTGGENVSLRAALDGGMFLRLGARDPKSKRRHIINGYKDGQGSSQWAVNDPSRKDSRTSGRAVYGSTDSAYRYHDMAQVGSPKLALSPFNSGLGDPTKGSMDTMGQSADIHAVRDMVLRVGAHGVSGQSLTLDLLGGLLAAIGKDSQGRSLTTTLDGGAEVVVGQANNKKGLKLEINGDVDVVIKGNLNFNVTGDITGECVRDIIVAKLLHQVKSTKIMRQSLTGIIDEAVSFVNNQGAYSSPA